MPMTIEQHRGLFLNKSRNESEHLPRARSFDQKVHALSTGVILNGFDRVTFARADCVISAKSQRQLTFVFTRLTYQQQSVVAKHAAKILDKHQACRTCSANQH